MITRLYMQYEAIQAVVRQYDEDPNDFAKLTDLIQEVRCMQCCLYASSKL